MPCTARPRTQSGSKANSQPDFLQGCLAIGSFAAGWANCLPRMVSRPDRRRDPAAQSGPTVRCGPSAARGVVARWGVRMWQRVRFRLAERRRRMRRLLALWRRPDPKAWIVALVGMAMGLGLFLLMLGLVGALRLVAYVVKSVH
jgi:hypothetical protein